MNLERIKIAIDLIKLNELKLPLEDLKISKEEVEALYKLEKIEEKSLEQILYLFKYFYYELDTQLIEDEMYDLIEEDLKQINPENQHFLEAGIGLDSSEIKQFNPKVKHMIIAGSQSKVNSGETQEINKKLETFDEESVVISDKLDGITVVSHYTNDYEKARAYLLDLKLKKFEYLELKEGKSKKDKQEVERIKDSIEKSHSELLEKIEKSKKEENYINYKILKRGDGIIGEDISFAGMYLKDINLIIKKESIPEEERGKDIIIRGEAVIEEEEIAKLPYKNARNGLGLLSKKELKNVDKVSFKPFEMIYVNEDETLVNIDREAMFSWFKNNDFNPPWFKKIDNSSDIEREVEDRLAKRNKGWVDGVLTDGVVISIDSAIIRESLGMSGKKPKGEFAYKPVPELDIGIIDKIEFEVGKSGIISSVAVLKEELLLGGTSVKRMSTSNQNIMLEIRPYPGAKVGVQKRGEIIPKIEYNLLFQKYNKDIEELFENIVKENILPKKEREEVISLLQNGKLLKLSNFYLDKNSLLSVKKLIDNLFDEKIAQKVKEVSNEAILKVVDQNEDLKDKILIYSNNKLEYPTKCPSCNLELKVGKALIKCINKECKDKVIEKISFFAKKLTKGISVGKITQLYELNKVRNFHDLFKMTEEDFKVNGEYIQGWKEKSAQNFIKAIQNLRQSRDNEVLGSLFFDNIGTSIFQYIFQKISLEEMKKDLDMLEEEDKILLVDSKETKPNFLKRLKKEGYSRIEVIEKLAQIDVMGPIRISELINTWIDEKEVIDEILKEFTFEVTEKIEESSEAFSFAVTGSIGSGVIQGKSFKGRKELEKIIKALGHKVSTVSSKTKALITDDDLDFENLTSKPQKANKLGVEILSSRQLIDLLKPEKEEVKSIKTEKEENKSRQP